MLNLLAMGQAGAAGMAASPAAVIVVLLLAIGLEALLLKLVAGSILGHPVGFSSALLATIAATLIQYVIGVAAGLFYSGGPGSDVTIEAAQAALARDPLMPFGFVPFLIGIATLAVALAIAVRVFIRSPDGEIPSWFNAALSALAVTILLTVLQYGMARGIAGA